MQSNKPRVALGKRLRACPGLHCYGVQTNWSDYPEEAQAAIREAGKVYYPSRLYEDLCLSLGKDVFPRNYYRFMGDKIRQTALFQLLDIPHPRTRLYYGRNRATRILHDFPPPLVAKTPRGSSMGQGVWLIRRPEELDRYLQNHHPAYIQEHLPIDRDLRVVLIAGQVVHAYWRVAAPGEFRNNVSQGAGISFEDIPAEALNFARQVAHRCRFDEVGLDVCRVDNRYYVLEANMAYGLEGFRRVGLNIYEIFCQLDAKGCL
jgi:ribosomal protein S6--L-glutamate ligase